jgi:hypothetical protein
MATTLTDRDVAKLHKELSCHARIIITPNPEVARADADPPRWFRRAASHDAANPLTQVQQTVTAFPRYDDNGNLTYLLFAV